MNDSEVLASAVAPVDVSPAHEHGLVPDDGVLLGVGGCLSFCLVGCAGGCGGACYSSGGIALLTALGLGESGAQYLAQSIGS